MGETPFNSTWDYKSRVYWWLRFWSAAIIIGAALSASFVKGYQWFVTRAGVDELKDMARQLDVDIQTRELKEDNRAAHVELNKKIDGQEVLLLNVRDNVVRLMAIDNVSPKPLPEVVKNGN